MSTAMIANECQYRIAGAQVISARAARAAHRAHSRSDPRRLEDPSSNVGARLGRRPVRKRLLEAPMKLEMLGTVTFVAPG
jgi:hypothetical protein